MDGIIVKVNNQIILRSDLKRPWPRKQPRPEKTLTEQERCNILRALVQQKLMVARAEIDSVVVEEEMVEGDAGSADGLFCMPRLAANKNWKNITIKVCKAIKDDLRKPVREQLIAEKMQGRNYPKSLSVTPNEVKKFFNKMPQDSLPYFSTEVEIGQIVKFAGVSKTQKDEVREPSYWNWKNAFRPAKSFATLATQYSEDPGSAKAGGELGFFKKRELVPEYEATALKLEPGQISDVVESQFGFHLIQLIERRGEEYNTRHILLKPTSYRYWFRCNGCRIK